MSNVDQPTATHRDQPLLGIAATLISVVLFSLMDALVKWLSADYPTFQIVFFRCAVALVPVLIFVFRAGGISLLRTKRPGLHLCRSVIGLGAMACAFYGFSVMRLADAVSVFYAAPLFMTALSVPMLGERVGMRRWFAIGVGFIGVLIVVRPGVAMFSGGGLVMLMSALLVGIGTNLIRKLNATDDPASITFYFTLTGTIAGTVACLFLGWVTPSAADLVLLSSVGILGGCAQYAVTLSFRFAQVGLLAPFKYLAIVVGGVLGYLVWDEVPDAQSMAGILVIVTSGMYMLHRDAKLSRRRTSNKVPPAEELG